MRFCRLAILMAFLSQGAHAAGLPFDPANFPDLNALISDDVAKVFVRSLGLMTAHRAYQPATGQGRAFDLGIEATIVRVPDELNAKLTELGVSSGSSIPTILPVPRLNLHKGLSDYVEIGGSLIAYQGFKIIGGDFKITIASPAEGPNWALRFNYTSTEVGFVKTKTYMPELLISRPMDFADPYLGLGYAYATGTIEVQIDPSLPTQVKEGSGGGTVAFLGVAFKAAPLGLKLSLEGSYSGGGAHSIGTKVGFNF